MASKKKAATKPQLSPQEMYAPPAQQEEPAAPVIPQLNLNEDPGLATAVFEKFTKSNMGALKGGELFQRKEVTAVIDGSVCLPGTFCDESGKPFDFKVTLRSLTSSEEIAVFNEVDVSEDQVSGAFQMAKKSLHKLNGAVIAAEQKDLLWELFGPGGRQLIVRKFGELNSISAGALGKFLSGTPEDLPVEG
jgi:hypothetical protein